MVGGCSGCDMVVDGAGLRKRDTEEREAETEIERGRIKNNKKMINKEYLSVLARGGKIC